MRDRKPNLDSPGRLRRTRIPASWVVALPDDINVSVVRVRLSTRQQRGHVNRHVRDSVEYDVIDTIVHMRVHRYRGVPTGPTIVAPHDESPVIGLEPKRRGRTAIR